MNETRLLPEGMYLNVCWRFYQPFDLNELGSNFPIHELLFLDGDLDGVVIYRDEITRLAKLEKCDEDVALERKRADIRQELIGRLSTGNVDSLYSPMPKEYTRKVRNATMTRDEIQEEIDALCRDYRFELPIEVKITKELIENTAGGAVLYGMSHSSRPHRIIVFIDYYATKLAKPFIKSLIRHEFAHCLADVQTWEELGRVSQSHDSLEWFQACEALGISPAARTEGNDAGFCHLWCERCGREKYELRNPKWDDLLGRELCGKCHKPYQYEIIDRPICFADGKTYIVEDDGRETPLPISADAFI